MPPTRRVILPLLLVLGLGTVACDRQQAYGDANAIIVGIPDARWAEVAGELEEALQPTIFTVRNERTFRLTQRDPAHRDWSVMREFQQVLLIGSPDDEWLADAVTKARREGKDLTPPTLVQTFDVWARGQVVSLMLTTPNAGLDELGPLVDSLNVILDRQFREIARTRMYASGRNDSLVAYLEREEGFALDFPRVYYYDQRDSVWLFRNDNPDPSRLIRQFAVTWRSPIPDEMPSAEQLAEWRDELVAAYYADEQVTELLRSEYTRGRLGEVDIVQLQASWGNPPGADWPSGGPLTLRAIACPEQDRLYLVDAWLYAPGDDKYQYMIQLETLHNSFRCPGPVPTRSGRPLSSDASPVDDTVR